MTEHAGLKLATEGKELEERYMRWLDKLGGDSVGPTPVCDAHMVALARTNVQQGTMWAVRAIFPAIRINLPEGGGRRRLGTMSKIAAHLASFLAGAVVVPSRHRGIMSRHDGYGLRQLFGLDFGEDDPQLGVFGLDFGELAPQLVNLADELVDL